MFRRNSIVKIKDDQILFSKEILEYFEYLRNEKNSEWIDKYFEVLSDKNNLISEKYNIHHIRPCCTFKDENHRNRKQTQKLADKFNGNLIKLSVYNHFFAHYYLWKIFNNRDCKLGFRRMCGQSNFTDNLTENELEKIAKLQEDCAKTNRTKQERKNYMKKYNKKRREEHKDEIAQEKKDYYIKNQERELKRVRQYRLDNIDKIREYDRERYHKNKEKIQRKENNIIWKIVTKYWKNKKHILIKNVMTQKKTIFAHYKHYKKENEKIKKNTKMLFLEIV